MVFGAAGIGVVAGRMGESSERRKFEETPYSFQPPHTNHNSMPEAERKSSETR